MMTLALLFLRGMFVAIGSVGGTVATSVLMPSFIFYAVVMVGVAAAIIAPIGMSVYYSESTVQVDKVVQQEWVVDAEMKLDAGFGELQALVAQHDYNQALAKYEELSNIYKWLEKYEVSEDKRRNYYLMLDGLKTQLDTMALKR